MTIKKLLAMFMVLILTLSTVSAFSFSVAAEEITASAGTTEITHLTKVPDGYIGIYTKADLDAVRNNLSGKYILMYDIVFTASTGWAPIGDEATPFTGIFDGNGYAIKNLFINISASSDTHVGLFGCNNGSIKNLGMEDSKITVNVSTTSSVFVYVGGIAGRNGNIGAITNCYNTGSVSADASPISRFAHAAYVGGIAGDSSGAITNCYNTGGVIADGAATGCTGGIAGGSSGTISSCYNTGSVSTTATDRYDYLYSGGIVGANLGTTSNCYNTGKVSSAAPKIATDFFPEVCAGGIAGGSSGTISSCYNTGKVSAEGTLAYVSGGAGYSSGTITYYYYLDNTDASVGNGADSCVKCTDSQMKNQATFVGFDFEQIWTMDGDPNYPYPELSGMSHNEDPHTHSFKTTWYKDSSKHWHRCAGCAERKDEGSHVYDYVCDASCNTCGYTRAVMHSHKTTWDKDASQHWYQCSTCGNKKDEADHKYDNSSDATCNDCGYTRTFATTPIQSTTSVTTTEPDTTTEPSVTIPDTTSDSEDKGDNDSNTVIIVIVTVAVLALCGIIGVVIFKKKRNYMGY
ncbi:MAG: hypothetical protein IJ404_05530 [Clostridia bacterium]|nr:hypothetical protein [Clostridia bacterium]